MGEFVRYCVQTKIIKQNGNVAVAGQIGELVVYGENVMDGYWNNQEETEKRFVVSGGKRGVKSGDLFYCDDDGFYYFCGRKEYYIKRRGIKISPIEIENYILKIEGVMQCVVLGCKHDVEGEVVVAIVSIAPDSDLNVNRLRNYIAGLPYEMKQTEIIITTDDIQCTSNGKYDRVKLAKLLVDKRKA